MQRRHRFPTPLMYIILLILCGLVLGGIIMSGVFGETTTRNESSVGNARNVPSGSLAILADDVAQRFMDAMMHKDWTTMWLMLHPDAQHSWQGERDFIHVEQAKFGPLHFIAYRMSPAALKLFWRNPDTTQTYPFAATFNVSFQILAPEKLLSTPSYLALEHGLFNNTPLALALDGGKWQILVAGPADLEAPILVPRSPPAVKLRVPIFMYHHVSDQPTRNPLDYLLTVRTTDFDEQLTWLQEHGYQSITQTELFDALYYGKALPARPMMLTFDDGYEDVYTDALPALLAHHYRGVFYIITGLIGGHYMTWDQVRTLAHDGMQVSSHTVHHVNIGNPPVGTNTQSELTLSRRTLEAQLGQPIQFFCYPSGEPFHHDTLPQRQTVLTDLFNDGYVGATLDPFAIFSVTQNAQTPYQLNRIRVSGGESLPAFIGILNATLKNSLESEILP